MKMQAAPLNNQLTVQCPPFLSGRETKAAAEATTDIRPRVCTLSGPKMKCEASLKYFLKSVFSPLTLKTSVFAVTHAGDAALFTGEKVGRLRQHCEDLSTPLATPTQT